MCDGPRCRFASLGATGAPDPHAPRPSRNRAIGRGLWAVVTRSSRSLALATDDCGERVVKMDGSTSAAKHATIIRTIQRQAEAGEEGSNGSGGGGQWYDVVTAVVQGCHLRKTRAIPHMTEEDEGLQQNVMKVCTARCLGIMPQGPDTIESGADNSAHNRCEGQCGDASAVALAPLPTAGPVGQERREGQRRAIRSWGSGKDRALQCSQRGPVVAAGSIALGITGPSPVHYTLPLHGPQETTSVQTVDGRLCQSFTLCSAALSPLLKTTPQYRPYC